MHLSRHAGQPVRCARLLPRRPALPCAAEAVQSIICKEFGRACMLVHNGVDCARFEPGPPAADILAAPTKVLTSPAYQVWQPACPRVWAKQPTLIAQSVPQRCRPAACLRWVLLPPWPPPPSPPPLPPAAPGPGRAAALGAAGGKPRAGAEGV